MSKSTEKMLKVLSKATDTSNSTAPDKGELPQVDELRKTNKLDMAAVLENCFLPDGPDSNPQSS